VETEVDPIVASVRRIGTAPAKAIAKDDAAALTAYYAVPNTKPIWTTSAGLTGRAKAAVAEISAAADWGLDPSAFDLPTVASDASVDAVAEAEIKLSAAVLKYARFAHGGRVNPSSISQLLDRKPRLFDPASVLRGAETASDMAAWLHELHPKHPQFVALQKALVAARKDADGPAGKKVGHDDVTRLVVNMERWRWMPETLGEFHVINNVPEQISRVYNDGKVVFQEKIVVGKAQTPTPSFSANMQFVIFHPEWGVPDGIKSNELAPALRRASANNDWGWFGGGSGGASRVLERYGLRMSYNGQMINPDTVNWSQTDIRRYSFIQPSGPQNVLGVVKFRFPNKHDVYMHDTPERSLFNNGVRAFSHGCMRVQNPVRLAEVLLAHDKGWSADKVNGFVRQGSLSEVKLSTVIPVHIAYMTARAEDDGTIKVYPDIYGLDSRIASAIAGRSVEVASKGAPKDDEPTPVRISSEKKKQPPRQVAQSSKQKQNDVWADIFGN
jgi:murein L,D-transpeptidase YcbB/YkuD